MQEKPLSAADKGHVNTNRPEKAPPYVLLPGDPDRVVTMTQQWDGIRNASDRVSGAPQVWTLARQAKCAVGTYMGAPIGAWSTGIGGPSAEFTLHEILDKGGETFIRVGTTGTIQPDIAVGDIIINDANIRLDGTSNLYVPDQFPAAASYEVTLALVQACENPVYLAGNLRVILLLLIKVVAVKPEAFLCLFHRSNIFTAFRKRGSFILDLKDLLSRSCLDLLLIIFFHKLSFL